MNIYKKLQEARVKLQSTQLKKSGNNKFAGYQYFELGDFLPTIQAIFNEIGLCGVVSFTNELAILNVFETEGDGTIQFTSPMAEASLKGCHPIQNLGAVQTYQRRYLWMAALEIVEHDALDASPPKEPDKPKTIEYCTDIDFNAKSKAWKPLIEGGSKTPEQLIATIQTKYLFTDAQKQVIRSWVKHETA